MDAVTPPDPRPVVAAIPKPQAAEPVREPDEPADEPAKLGTDRSAELTA